MLLVQREPFQLMPVAWVPFVWTPIQRGALGIQLNCSIVSACYEPDERSVYSRSDCDV